MELRGGLSRITFWLAIAALTTIGLAVAQKTSPSLVENPVQQHNLFDVELLSHTEPTTFTAFSHNGTTAFVGDIDSGTGGCVTPRSITVRLDDGVASVPDSAVATATTSTGGAFTTTPFPNPPGTQTYYAVVSEGVSGSHTCAAATSSSITI